MQEQFLMYIMLLYFIFSCYKGYKHGASYESVSILSFLVASIISIFIYSDELINKVLSTIVFSLFYFFGLFLSFLVKRKTIIEKIIGIFLGGLKYFLHLIFINIISYFSNSRILPYDENILIRNVNLISIAFKEHIERDIWGVVN